MKKRTVLALLIAVTSLSVLSGCNKNESLANKKDNIANSNKEEFSDTYEEYDGEYSDYSEPSDEDSSDSYSTSSVDVEEYYNRTSEILSKTDVESSPNQVSEKQAKKDFADRGFKDFPIMTYYDAKGNSEDKEDISENSDEIHPSYIMYYYTTNKNLWVIYETNGQFQAYPTFYIMAKSEKNENVKDMILCESESINVHIPDNNQFYDIIPNGTDCVVRKVDRIDAEYISSLTQEDIDGLW